MDNPEKPRLTIITPTLNEGGNIHKLMQRIDAALSAIKISYQVYFIDDHSTDTTVNEINELAGRYPIKCFSKEGHRGKGYSIVQGFSLVDTELVAVLDADLQYPPEAIPEMIAKIDSGEADMVITRYVCQ